jgi:hypothetical protein
MSSPLFDTAMSEMASTEALAKFKMAMGGPPDACGLFQVWANSGPASTVLVPKVLAVIRWTNPRAALWVDVTALPQKSRHKVLRQLVHGDWVPFKDNVTFIIHAQ